jgi:Tfp pilus assembly protein PilX
MRRNDARKRNERGTILLVVVFIAAAIAGLAAISSGRVVHASKRQTVMENETRAFNSAYAQIHMAMNVVNNSAYDELNHNLILQAAVAGEFGGTVASGKEAYATLETPGGENTGYIPTEKDPHLRRPERQLFRPRGRR